MSLSLIAKWWTMVHISRDNLHYLIKNLPLVVFFLAAIKIKWLKFYFRAGAVREKALSLGQSVRSSASTVRYPHEERPKFLTCQKFIRPSDCLSGETYRFSFPPVHCTNTARQTTHDKAEIRPDSKNSRTSQNSAQNRTKIAQCMPGLREEFPSFSKLKFRHWIHV